MSQSESSLASLLHLESPACGDRVCRHSTCRRPRVWPLRSRRAVATGAALRREKSSSRWPTITNDVQSARTRITCRSRAAEQDELMGLVKTMVDLSYLKLRRCRRSRGATHRCKWPSTAPLTRGADPA